MRILRMSLTVLTIAILFQAGVLIAQTQDHNDEILSLLNRLIPTEKGEGATIVITGPNQGTKDYVQDRLLQIARESPESRSQVIQTSIEILNDPSAAEEYIIAYRWTAAVYVLGELRAAEGIDALVKNLDKNV